jgi:hypothetical protein
VPGDGAIVAFPRSQTPEPASKKWTGDGKGD